MFDIENENRMIRKAELELDLMRINDRLSQIDTELQIALMKLKRDTEAAKQASERDKERYFDTLMQKEAELEKIKKELLEVKQNG